MERSKEDALLELARILEEQGVPYALIGGVAVQIHSRDPRTTLDIDIAVLTYEDLPVAELEAGGFSRRRRFEHSENWSAADGTPVQFTDEVMLADAVRRAEPLTFGGRVLRVATVVDLVRAKLLAARDPRRRRSKRLMDIADAQGLVEDHPEVRASLTDAERQLLDALP